MARRVLFGVVGVVAGLAVGACAAVGATDVARGDGLLSWKNPFQAHTVDRSQPVLLKSVQGLSQYHAAVGNFSVVVDTQLDKTNLPTIRVGRRDIFTAEGSVDAYVDLGGLPSGDLTLSHDGKTATVRLPEAKLGQVNLDQKNTRLVDEQRGVVTAIGDSFSTPDQQKLYVLAEQKIDAAATRAELTTQADANTRAMLTGMFGSMGVAVRFANVAK